MVMMLGCSSPVDETINGLMTSLSICSDDGKVSTITPPRSPPGQQKVLYDIPENDTPVSSFRRDNNTEPPPQGAVPNLPILPVIPNSMEHVPETMLRRTASLEEKPQHDSNFNDVLGYRRGEQPTTVFSDPTTGPRYNEEHIRRILHEAMLASREAKSRNPLSTEEVLDFAKKVVLKRDDGSNSETQEIDDEEPAGFLGDAVEDDQEIVQDMTLEEKARKVNDAIEMMRALQNGDDANDIDDLSRQTSADEIIFESTDLLKDASPIETSKLAGEGKSPSRHAKFADSRQEDEFELGLTESEVASFEGLPANIRSHWKEGESEQEQILQRLDGVRGRYPTDFGSISRTTTTELQNIRSMEEYVEEKKGEPSSSFFDSWPLNYLWGTSMSEDQPEGRKQGTGWRHNDDTLSLLSCNMIRKDERLPAMASSLVRVTSMPPPPSYAETIRRTEVDPRMQLWVESQWAPREKPPSDGAYYLGKSRTVVVHEIARGDWTWCTEWSPKGDRLAVATENHHLAVIDTTSSTVWRVIHDARTRRPPKKDTTHSIRAIAWGSRYIAIGGTGNAVSILSPEAPYPVIHTIKDTGFVGSLDWNADCSVLVIGSRLNKAMIFSITACNETPREGETELESELLQKIDFKNWVNRVVFSHGGSCLAIGDAGGTMSVYGVVGGPRQPIEVNLIKNFAMEDSVLDIEWSPDGKWLYVGGEDFNVTVIEKKNWEIVYKIDRERWVQSIASSHSGTHLAVGGVSSEISILDVKNGWESVIGIELKGVVPLSAKWHPKDQYLAVTGQNNSVLVVETTNARHVKGHHLHAISPILAIEFSPDGRMAVIGNETGVVTFFSLSGTTFITAYELVVTLNDRLSIQWSLNGAFAAIASKDALIVVQPRKGKKGRKKNKRLPPNASDFSVRRVVRDIGEIHAVSIDSQSQYVAVSGVRTRVLDVANNFKQVLEMKNGPCYANAWSPDGRWLATTGQDKVLTIYDTSSTRVDRWRAVFSLKCDFVGLSLAWSPLIVGGLLYLAYGGDGNVIFIMEIRALEGSWETVLRIKRDGAIQDLDWNTDGLLAAAIGNGTVCVVDLCYLQSGVAVNEFDYNFQRQGLTSYTEIRRNKGKNSMRSVRFIPSAKGSDSLLAIGGSDGEVEILDLTERRRCSAYEGRQR